MSLMMKNESKKHDWKTWKAMLAAYRAGELKITPEQLESNRERLVGPRPTQGGRQLADALQEAFDREE